MGTNENKEVIRRIANMVNAGEYSGTEELLDEDVVYRSTAGEEVHGRDAMLDLFGSYAEALSDFQIDLEDIVGEGDVIYVQYRQTGTHTGEFWGIEPTNNKTNILITGRVKFQNGKVVEQHDTFDTLELLKQLDALPEEVETQLPQPRA